MLDGRRSPGHQRHRGFVFCSAILALATLSLVLLACGPGGGAPPTPASTAPLSDAAGSTASEGVDVRAFRYRLTMTLEGSDRPFRLAQSGEVVLPDREHATQSVEVAWLQHESERLVIGEREWVRGGLPWMDFAASPLDYLGSGDTPFSRAHLEQMSFTEETVRGIATRRYELGDESLRALADTALNPDGPINATLWFAPDLGVPVALELVAGSDDGMSLRLHLEVYDVNATDIAIEEPTVGVIAGAGEEGAPL